MKNGDNKNAADCKDTAMEEDHSKDANGDQEKTAVVKNGDNKNAADCKDTAMEEDHSKDANGDQEKTAVVKNGDNKNAADCKDAAMEENDNKEAHGVENVADSKEDGNPKDEAADDKAEKEKDEGEPRDAQDVAEQASSSAGGAIQKRKTVFVREAKEELQAQGMSRADAWKEANALWMKSDVRRVLVSAIPEGERKKRRFA